MEQMKINTCKELEKIVSDKITELVQTVKNSEHKRVHSGKESYGVAIVRYVELKQAEKLMKKKLDEIIDSLDGEFETPGKLADLAGIAIQFSRICVMMAADAINGCEDLNDEVK